MTIGKLFAISLLFATGVASAQIGSSTITGRVTDTTGAVVPTVVVSLVQTDTNFQFSAVTNADGLYRVSSLQPGSYRLTFSAAGFKKFTRENVELRVDTVLAVDATLQVGEVTESIAVADSVPLLETETSSTGSIMKGTVLYNLPLYQRYVNYTLALVPGLTTTGYAQGASLTNFHLAGQRDSAIGIYEDGVLGNDQLGGTGTIKVIQNAVSEVKVLTTTLPAEYGHSAGGVINVVKKSGSNQLHGMASAFGNTRSMTHRLFFEKVRPSTPTPTNPNGLPAFFLYPDANVGGPVFIPKLYDGRNKTFFFFSTQQLFQKNTRATVSTAPNAAMKSGDFSFGGVGNPLFDPLTTRQEAGRWVRDPIPGNRIPLSRFDPVARKILEIDPWVAPNVPGTFNANGPADNLIANEFALVRFYDYSTRIDHQFNSNLKIYGSHTYNFFSGYGRPVNMKNKDLDGQQGNNSPLAQQIGSVGNTFVISPATVNDARIGYFRRGAQTIVPSLDKDYGQILGIPNISPRLMPALGVGNRDTADSIYGITGAGPSRQLTETISFRDDFTKIVATHAFKMGYELLRFRLNSTATNRPSGTFLFDGMTAGLQADGLGALAPRTGNTFAGFLLGSVRQAQFDSELTSWLPRSSIHSFYFQDDWKFSPTLTFNLGVRYSNESPFNTKYGLMSNFDPNSPDALTGQPGAIAHPTAPLNRRDKNNFQPRIGVAWHAWPKWVFRSGFAVNTVDVKFPLARDQFDEYVALSVQQRAPGDPRPLFQISQGPAPATFNILNTNTSLYTGSNFGSRNVSWWDPNLRNPYVMNWNVSAQYQLAENYLLEISYQGSGGVGLIERWQVNTFPVDYSKGDPGLQARVFAAPQNYRPYPQFGNVLLRSNFGHSTFHSGTVKLEKRYSRGLIFSNFYTFSKSIDSQDNDNDGSGVAPIQNRALEKGRSSFDRNHRYVGVVTYELPMGKGKRFLNRGGILNYALGGYEIAWIQTLESGNPLTFTFANSPFNYYPVFAGNLRPDLVGKPRLRDGWRDVGGDRFNSQNSNPVLDINAFAYPAAFTPGNSGRNIVTGTPLIWSQVSARKNFRIGERFNAQFRWDFQNALHTFNFDPPTRTVDFQNPRTFGKLVSDARTALIGGQPLMNLTIILTF